MLMVIKVNDMLLTWLFGQRWNWQHEYLNQLLVECKYSGWGVFLPCNFESRYKDIMHLYEII
jgi:hypothetical protein